jgi:hypothetical protein
MRSLFVVLLFASVTLTEGDRHWSQRAEGSTGGRALAAPIDRAVASYEKAIAQDPASLEPRWKLLRALRFKGAYVARTNDEKKAIYSRAKTAGDEALVLVERALQARGVKSPRTAPEEQVAAAARQIPGAAEVFVWDAVNWGEWALAYGKMAAARQGAADRIRSHAGIAHLINPALEGGTPSRVLGRLHDQTPRIPFITGWASQKEAVRFLTESQKVDPANKITLVFLAEALVSQSDKARPRAIQILRNVVAAPDGSEYRVEQAAATEEARTLLKKWGA